MENCFVTLTYKEEPAGGNLEPRDLQLFLKRLRNAIAPTKVRFFAVGEYGENTFRPHYHLSLFGLSPFSNIGSTIRGATGIIEDAWGLGYVDVAELNEKTTQYVAGYVVKKFTDWRDNRLGNRHPEFARMSLRPGIGAPAVKTIADQLLSRHQDWSSGDVPRELSLGRRKIPLDRFMLQKLRVAVGFSEEYIRDVKAASGAEASLELRTVFKAALDLDPHSSVVTPKKIYEESVRQRILQAETRAAIFKKRAML